MPGASCWEEWRRNRDWKKFGFRLDDNIGWPTGSQLIAKEAQVLLLRVHRQAEAPVSYNWDAISVIEKASA